LEERRGKREEEEKREEGEEREGRTRGVFVFAILFFG
jgi:hypothetical protein